MFKISIVDTEGRRRMVVHGKLAFPWTTEVETAWRSAAEQLGDRKLVIDLTNVTLISQDGENTLFELMKAGARFSGKGVLITHLLKQLARRCRCNPPVDVDSPQARTTNH
jgi:hypothetical protein